MLLVVKTNVRYAFIRQAGGGPADGNGVYRRGRPILLVQTGLTPGRGLPVMEEGRGCPLPAHVPSLPVRAHWACVCTNTGTRVHRSRTHASEQTRWHFLFALRSPAAGGPLKSFSLPAVTFLKQTGPPSVTSPSRASAILTTCVVHMCHECTHACAHMHTARSPLSPGLAPAHHPEGHLADPIQAERGCLSLRPPRCPLSWWLVAHLSARDLCVPLGVRPPGTWKVPRRRGWPQHAKDHDTTSRCKVLIAGSTYPEGAFQPRLASKWCFYGFPRTGMLRGWNVIKRLRPVKRTTQTLCTVSSLSCSQK